MKNIKISVALVVLVLQFLCTGRFLVHNGIL
jgi:hypothetical protein